MIDDILLPMVVLSPKQFKHYVAHLQKSNLPIDIQADIRELLRLAVEQTREAKRIGWV